MKIISIWSIESAWATANLLALNYLRHLSGESIVRRPFRE
jgi:hypothetical protein